MATVRKVASFEDFVQVAVFFYRSIGIQPYGGGSQSLLFDAIFYVGVVNMNLVLLVEMLFVMFAFMNHNNFLEATMTLSYIGFVSVGDFKLLSVWRKRSTLTQFVQQLQAMFPCDEPQQEVMQLRRYLRQSSLVTITFALMYMVLIWTYNLYAMVEYVVYERWLGVRVVGQRLPYFCYIPWDWDGHWSYYPLYVLQVLAGYTSATGQIASDLLLCAMATQVVMHYDHVARSIRAYQVRAGNAGNALQQAAQRDDMRFLNDMIAYHDQVLRLSDVMNDVFGAPLLVNFMTSSFIICFVGFQMTIGVTPELAFKLSLFLFSSMAQVYLICHYGQLLIDASVSIASAVYEQDWSSAEVRYQKMLVLMAKRAQKPAQLNATSFVHISRRTMTEIMQMSYKFFALLRTIYSE